MAKKQTTFRVLERRVELTRMYIQGFTQTEIAVRLKIDQGTVCNELRKIREEWLESIVCNYDEIKSRELAKIDNLEKVAWEAWFKSCEPAESEKKQIQSAVMSVEEKTDEIDEDTGEYISCRKSIMTPIKEHFETLRKGQNGNPAFLDRVAWCIEMRLKIFGILKEEKKEINNIINFDFDQLIGKEDNSDPIEDKIIEVQAMPINNSQPSSNGESNGVH